jgi:HK97 family phage portal protein
LTVTPDLALQVSCIFTGVRLISEVCGALPFELKRERGDGGFYPEDDPFLGAIFDDRANPWQTPQEWRETMTAQAILWPQALSEKKVGANGLELHPIEPEYITKTEQVGNGTLRWTIQEPGQSSRTLVQDEVFRMKGFGAHCFMGADLLRLARETVGLWLAQEKFGGLYFRQGAKPSVWLQMPQGVTLSDSAYKRLQETAGERYSGLTQMHKAFVIEGGGTVKEVGNSAKDAQLVEFREALVHECARWLNIPVHMFRAGDQPTFASVEQFAREFVDYTLMPWLVRWEQRVKFDLLTKKGVIARHNLDALLRGSMVERYQAYAIGIMNGILGQNEVRIKEGLNPVKDPAMDKPARSTNQGHPADAPQFGNPAAPEQQQSAPVAPKKKKQKVPPAEGSTLREQLFTRQAAERVVNKETQRIRSLALKHASDGEAFLAAVDTFYGEHSGHVAEVMLVAPPVARIWTSLQSGKVKAEGIAAVEAWEEESIETLTRLALKAA